MVLADYTHLLNYITWFNEATIQSKLNLDFGSNLTSSEVEDRCTVPKLELLRDELVATFDYMFNKPDVTSPDVELVHSDHVSVSATWGGVTKDLIATTPGSGAVFDTWKQRAWNNEHETGLYANTFTFAETFEEEEVPYIGIAVSMLDVVIVIIIKTSEDNSIPPLIPVDPSDPSDEDRGLCTDGLDIEVCEDYDEEEEDDCEHHVEVLCDSNFQPAN